MLWNYALRIFNFLASLELAVILILTVGAVLAVGTVYEAKYSAAVASQLVYRSWWMQVLLWLFVTNVAAAAVSRLPWKKQHVGFLITHLGIIVLLVGAWMQQQRGVDGILALAPGESGRLVRIDQNMLYVYKTVPGKAYDLVLNEELNFDLRAPMTEPVRYRLTGADAPDLRVLRYYPKARREIRAENAPEGQGVPAVRFKLFGSRASFDDWIFLQKDIGSRRDVGPAEIRFAKRKPSQTEVAEKASLLLYLDKKDQPPRIALARKGERFQELGRAVLGKSVSLGWMDFEFQLDAFHGSAIPRAEYSPLSSSSAAFDGIQAIEVEMAGDRLWLELGSSAQITAGDGMYYLQFVNRQVDLGFELVLDKFDIEYYEGTSRPMEYASTVSVAGQTHRISMNQPLKHGGFTFYQASYESDEEGVPRVSVLSVNYDPGRGVKYLGSLMMCLGIISMFYFKPKYSGTNKWLLKKKEESV